MRSMFNILIQLFKLFLGAFIILIGSVGVFVNLHDWFFLFLNLIFLSIGVVLFLTPVSSENA